jgi:hypothetical protein
MEKSQEVLVTENNAGSDRKQFETGFIIMHRMSEFDKKLNTTKWKPALIWSLN